MQKFRRVCDTMRVLPFLFLSLLLPITPYQPSIPPQAKRWSAWNEPEVEEARPPTSSTYLDTLSSKAKIQEAATAWQSSFDHDAIIVQETRKNGRVANNGVVVVGLGKFDATLNGAAIEGAQSLAVRRNGQSNASLKFSSNSASTLGTKAFDHEQAAAPEPYLDGLSKTAENAVQPPTTQSSFTTTISETQYLDSLLSPFKPSSAATEAKDQTAATATTNAFDTFDPAEVQYPPTIASVPVSATSSLDWRLAKAKPVESFEKSMPTFSSATSYLDTLKSSAKPVLAETRTEVSSAVSKTYLDALTQSKPFASVQASLVGTSYLDRLSSSSMPKIADTLTEAASAAPNAKHVESVPTSSFVANYLDTLTLSKPLVYESAMKAELLAPSNYLDSLAKSKHMNLFASSSTEENLPSAATGRRSLAFVKHGTAFLSKQAPHQPLPPDIVAIRKQPKPVEEEAKLAGRYAAIEDMSERAFTILADLRMIELNPDPSSPDFDHSEDDEFVDDVVY